MFKPRFDIVNHYTVLHFDEWDILFAGKNTYNEWIVGSLAYDDEENNILHYYYLIVSEKRFVRFLRQEITYRALFIEAIKIYKTVNDINGNLIDNYQELTYENISKSALPSENSLCPPSDELEYLLKQITKDKIAFSNNWTVFSNIDDVKETILKPDKKAHILRKENKLPDKALVSKNLKKYKATK